jgi:hypothetical protein
MGPRASLEDMENEKFMTLLGLKTQLQSPVIILAPQDFTVSK